MPVGISIASSSTVLIPELIQVNQTLDRVISLIHRGDGPVDETADRLASDLEMARTELQATPEGATRSAIVLDTVRRCRQRLTQAQTAPGLDPHQRRGLELAGVEVAALESRLQEQLVN